MSRAFKPMPIVLDLVYKNFAKYKNLIFFMGKTGKKIFEDAKKFGKWILLKKSLTNPNSFLLNIKKIKKKELDANYFNYKSKGWSRKNYYCNKSCFWIISAE